MINKHFFLHAHFDLPPALQPWHGETEPDPAAEPYANLYEQLFQTALGPNTASPLLDEDGRILKFVNNFSYIGFDISPELFGWIERKHPRIYARILESDKQQRSRHGGHGGAIATAAVSLIAPLESDLDKRAAILWGIADFQRRFDRAPEGFWLPENAADEKTLEILAEEGIQYTLLAPRHAEAVRPVDSTDEKDWQRVASETLGTTRPYRWRSKSDPQKTLAVFFYRTDLNPARIYDKLPFALSTQTPLKTSREQVLDVGRRFANRMIDSFTANKAVEFSYTAVDGGLFGYSRLNGNRALTYSLDYLLREAPAKLTTPGEFLKLFPPPEEVRLCLGSRSCSHGVLRWSGACDCSKTPAEWKRPFREAIDQFARDVDEFFAAAGADIFLDANDARIGYGAVVSRPGEEAVADFLEMKTRRHPTPGEARRAVRLCEMWRWRLSALSYWSYEEESPVGRAALYALNCAARSLDILEAVDGPVQEFETRFLEKLSAAAASGSALINAAQAYKKIALPERITSSRALAHGALWDHLHHPPSPSGGLGDSSGTDYPSIKTKVHTLARRTRRRDRKMDCLSIAFADYAHLRTFEKDRALTVVMQRNSTDLDCWILRGKEDELSRIAAGIESAYLRLPLAAFNSRIADLRPGEAWSLDALFSRQRRQAVLRMMPRQDTRQARYLDGWHASLKRHKQGAADWEELADRLAQSAQEGVAADFLPKIADFRNAVLQAARRFAKRPSADTLDHLTLLLDSSGQGGLHLPLWEIQEFAWQGVQDLKAEEEDVEIVEWLVRVLGISEALLIAPPEQ